MSDLPARLRDLAIAVAACEWELPIDAVETCNAAAIAIEMAKKDLAEIQERLTSTQ